MDISTTNLLIGAAIALVATLITSVINHFLESSRNEKTREVETRKTISKYHIDNIEKVLDDLDELSKSTIDIGTDLSIVLTTSDPKKLLLQAENISKFVHNGLLVYINLSRIDNPEIKQTVFDYRDEVINFYNYLRNIIFQKYENKAVNNEEIQNEMKKWTGVVINKYYLAINALMKERDRQVTNH
jgi:hypothetical protein